MRDALALPVAFVGDVEKGAEPAALFGAQDRLHLGRRPDEELALLALRIGVGRRIEPALGADHLPQDVLQDLARDPGVEGVPRDLVALQVGLREQGVVVEHLFEVGDQPALIRGVAGKAAADLVIHPALGHAIQGLGRHGQGCSVAGPAVVSEEKRDLRGRGKLGRGPESPVRRVEPGGQFPHGGAYLRLADVPARDGLGPPAEVRGERLRLLDEVGPASIPQIGDLGEEGREPGPPESVPRGEVGPREERPLIRGQEDRHGPAALSVVQRQRGGHVDVVQVGTLFAVHLDVHEVPVHEGCDGLILE